MYKTDLSNSSNAFQSVVWPSVAPKLGAGKLVPIEGNDNHVTQLLDQNAGVDYLTIMPDGGIRPLAARVQFTSTNWATFTVRYSKTSGSLTEFAKRQRDISQGYLYPFWTIQAYVHKDKLISAAAIRTFDLFHFISHNSKDVITRSTTNADFLVIKWSLLDKIMSFTTI